MIPTQAGIVLLVAVSLLLDEGEGFHDHFALKMMA